MTLLTEAPAAAPDYAAMALARLGAAEPLAMISATPRRLRRSLQGLADEPARRPERPGKWSVIEVVQHLADYDLVNGYRLRMVLAHDTPALQGYDQDAWAATLRYASVPMDVALRQFDALREATLRLLRTLDADQWRRAGLHAERGPETVETIVRLMAGHDLLHLDQIARIRRTLPDS